MKIATTLGLALVVLLAIPAIRHLREQPPEPQPPIRLSFPMPSNAEAGWDDEPLDAAIAPNESEVVFVVTRLREGFGGQARQGVPQLWRRSLADPQAEPIPGTEGAQQPAWKQTGNVIAFFAAGRLKQITLVDGATHDLAGAASPAGATWLRDGSLLFATQSPGPIRALMDGTVADATTLAPGDTSHEFPVAVSGTNDFVYVAIRDNGRRLARLSAGGQETDLIATSGHAALVGDRLLHVRDGVLLAYGWNADTRQLAPRGTPIGLDVGVSSSGRALLAASERLLLYAPAVPRPYALAWLDASGTRAGTIADAGEHWQVRLSPDDRFAAVTTADPLLRALDIVIYPATGAGAPEKLTLALAADSDPVWSPDGTRVLFRSMEGGTPDLYVKRPFRGESTSEPLLRSDLDETPTDWTAAGAFFHARGRTGIDILRLDTETGEYEAVADMPFDETDARWSPDRQWMAYVWDAAGRPDIYARRPDGTRVRVSFGGGTRPRWTRDGAIVFLRGSHVMRADRVAGEPPRFTPPRLLFEAPGIRDVDTAHRSDRFAALLPVNPGTRAAISVVVNWGSLFSVR